MKKYTSACALVAVSLILNGCSKKEEATPAEQVNIAESTDVFTAPVAPAEAAAADDATVVAIVEGQEITQGEVNKEVAGVMARMQGRVPPERIAQLQSTLSGQTLDALVTKTLLSQAIEKENIAVTDEEIDEAIAKIQGSFPPGKTLDDVLQSNNKTIEDFRKDLTLELRVNKLIEKQVEGSAAPTDEEIAKYYEENKQEFEQPETVTASHILIATEETDTEEQKAAKKTKAEELRKKLIEGEDFAKCAGENSDCPSKERGGDLGSFQRGQMVKPFEDAAFSQPIGEVGPIVETQFGYHIIKVIEREDAKTVALDEVKERLSEYLTQQKKQTAARDYVMALKEKANVTYPQEATSAPTAVETPEVTPASAEPVVEPEPSASEEPAAETTTTDEAPTEAAPSEPANEATPSAQ